MELRDLLRNYQVYIDTSALMNTDRLQLLVDNIEKDITLRKKIIILANVYQELMDFSKGYNNDKRILANYALDIISNSNAFIVNPEFKRKKKPFADPKILTTLIENKIEKPQIIITFDKSLAIDANNLNDLKCMNGNEIKVLTISEDGELIVPDYLNGEVVVEDNCELDSAYDIVTTTVEANDEKCLEDEEIKVVNIVNKKKSIIKSGKFWIGNLTGGLLVGAAFIGKKILSKVL